VILSGLADDWQEALADQEMRLTQIETFLREESAEGRGFLPETPVILRAFTQSLADVRVLIVGQDPYPTPGHAVGLAFAVSPATRPLPRSLQNIFSELKDDLGHPSPASGDLSPWCERGVLLLNRVLTVAPGRPGSHRGHGWEEFTAAAIDALVARGGPLVAILWGADAAALTSRMGSVPTIASAHPSPLSAARGFFGSKPFSRANAILINQGVEPINWTLPSAV